MSFHIPLRDHLRETQLFNQRAVTFVVICAFLILAIIARLIYLQILNHDHYTTLSKNNRLHIVPIAPTRGLIYDRNGNLLWEIFGEGKRTRVPLAQIPQNLIDATIAVEDDTFYENIGLDAPSLVAALISNLRNPDERPV